MAENYTEASQRDEEIANSEMKSLENLFLLLLAIGITEEGTNKVVLELIKTARLLVEVLRRIEEKSVCDTRLLLERIKLLNKHYHNMICMILGHNSTGQSDEVELFQNITNLGSVFIEMIEIFEKPIPRIIISPTITEAPINSHGSTNSHQPSVKESTGRRKELLKAISLTVFFTALAMSIARGFNKP